MKSSIEPKAKFRGARAVAASEEGQSQHRDRRSDFLRRWSAVSPKVARRSQAAPQSNLRPLPKARIALSSALNRRGRGSIPTSCSRQRCISASYRSSTQRRALADTISSRLLLWSAAFARFHPKRKANPGLSATRSVLQRRCREWRMGWEPRRAVCPGKFFSFRAIWQGRRGSGLGHSRLAQSWVEEVHEPI
jgi:hypothetical protein